jgi:hypothetical protein
MELPKAGSGDQIERQGANPFLRRRNGATRGDALETQKTFPMHKYALPILILAAALASPVVGAEPVINSDVTSLFRAS